MRRLETIRGGYGVSAEILEPRRCKARTFSSTKSGYHPPDSMARDTVGGRLAHTSLFSRLIFARGVAGCVDLCTSAETDHLDLLVQ